jgi:putative nucleotidyltransferase with HDIG domain
MSTLLWVLVGWVGVSLLAYLLVYPLLTASARSDPLHERFLRRGRETAGVPSPQGLGYAGMVLDRLARHARTVLGFSQAWILVNPPGTVGFVAAVAGGDPDLVGRRFAAAYAPELSAAATAPFAGESEARGTLGLGAPEEERELEGSERELLRQLSTLAGEMLRHHAHHELTLGDSSAEISALVRALAEGDRDTYRHSLEVAATARAVAVRLGLDGPDLVEVELGALLHDVGKLRMPPDLLQKGGRLTAEERGLMQLHPEWGSEMVGRIPGLEAVAVIVGLHHERPDGRGYPYGLTDERIPMASRIVSVCAAYGVMTKRWSYRDAIEVDAALDELRRNAGTQFDPNVVEALASVVSRRPAAAAA